MFVKHVKSLCFGSGFGSALLVVASLICGLPSCTRVYRLGNIVWFDRGAFERYVEKAEAQGFYTVVNKDGTLSAVRMDMEPQVCVPDNKKGASPYVRSILFR